MADFNSKYSGEQVEELLDQMANGGTGGGGGGGITVETDPIFSASPAASITEAKKTEWDNKVDKVDGKQLSTEDFTTTLKQKLDGLSNYDDTTISQAVEKLRTDLDALVSGDTTTAIKTFNEVIAFLDGISDTEDLSGIIASIEQQIAGKQDKINDIDNIRSGAAKGATSAQQEELQTGASAVVVPDGVLVDGGGSTYALPDVDETTKEASDYVLATEDYVDSKVGSGGGGSKVFVEFEPMKDPLGYFGQLGAIIPNNVYVFTKPIQGLRVQGLTESDSKGDEYSIMFTASKDNVSISLPSSPYKIYWANGVIPTINSDDLCELSLVRIGYDIKAVLTTFKTV